ncbi:MAG: GDSL-type esterase/lipase family protein [Acidimicrobiales bacterium]
MPATSHSGPRRPWRVATVVAAAVLVVALAGCSGSGTVDTAAPTGSAGAPSSTAPTKVVSHGPRLLMAGDSVGLFVGIEVAKRARELGITFENKANWVCGMVKVPRYRHAGGTITDAGANCFWPEVWAGETLPRFTPDVVLVMVGGTGLGDWEVEGDFRGPCDPVFDRWYTEGLGAQIDRLAATGSKVVLTTEPYPRLFPQPADLDARTDCANRSLREAAAAHGAAVVDLAAFICPDGQCVTTKDGVTLRADGVHFSNDGAVYLARWIVPEAFRAAGLPVPTPG